MQGRKDPRQRLFYQINLTEFVPADHLLKRLDAAVSLKWIRAQTKDYYSRTGKPSIDPVVLVKMLFIGYLYNIRSERRLVEEISLNLAYRWYTGYDLDESVPNHSVFSKARRRFGKELFVEIFTAVLRQCARAGLLSLDDDVFVDSTLVKANASFNSLVSIDLDPEQYWRNLDEEETKASPQGRKPAEHKASQVGTHSGGKIDKEKIGRRRRDRQPSYLAKRSKTDPDATVHYRPGIGSLLSYKAHVAAAKTGIITAVSVTPSATHDTAELSTLTKRHEKALGKVPSSVVADSSYGTKGSAWVSAKPRDKDVHSSHGHQKPTGLLRQRAV